MSKAQGVRVDKAQLHLWIAPELATELRILAAKDGTQGALSRVTEQLIRKGME